ncbi:MAG: hypothetical protein LBQ50_04410 [Planctomycetaceae bacterium]|jgi:hypothetical protein|nr:hypothetical protein [Planctomycetaceae bacterium]
MRKFTHFVKQDAQTAQIAHRDALDWEGIRLLETLGTIQLQFPNPNDESKNITINSVPTPREEIAELFRLANIPAPEFIPAGKTKQANTVDSKKKLKIRRKP